MPVATPLPRPNAGEHLHRRDAPRRGGPVGDQKLKPQRPSGCVIGIICKSVSNLTLAGGIVN
jgi:hypothetical protein